MYLTQTLQTCWWVTVSLHFFYTLVNRFKLKVWMSFSTATGQGCLFWPTSRHTAVRGPQKTYIYIFCAVPGWPDNLQNNINQCSLVVCIGGLAYTGSFTVLIFVASFYRRCQTTTCLEALKALDMVSEIHPHEICKTQHIPPYLVMFNNVYRGKPTLFCGTAIRKEDISEYNDN